MPRQTFTFDVDEITTWANGDDIQSTNVDEIIDSFCEDLAKENNAVQVIYLGTNKKLIAIVIWRALHPDEIKAKEQFDIAVRGSKSGLSIPMPSKLDIS